MASILRDSDLHGDDDTIDGEPVMTLTKTWVVRVKGSNKTWVPEILDKFGLLFIRLQKFDRQLTQFVLEKSMDMRAGKNISCNTKSFDDLLELRRKASIEAVEAALRCQDPDAEKDQAKKSKRRVVREEDKDFLDSPWVFLELPQIQVSDGTTMGPHTCKVLFGLREPDIWMEFGAINLLYFKTMILKDHQEGQFGRTRVVKRKRGSPKRSPRNTRASSVPSTPDGQFPVTSPNKRGKV
eukprot:symbB.v1.2.027060.t2/scaffold2750.1/size124631/5